MFKAKTILTILVSAVIASGLIFSQVTAYNGGEPRNVIENIEVYNEASEYEDEIAGAVYRASNVKTSLTVNSTSTFQGDLLTNGNNAVDIGAFGNAYKDIYASGTLYLGAVLSSGDLDPSANNASDIGQFGLAWKNLYVSSTSFLGSVTSTMITPWTNNVSDLGDYGLAWNNLFVSSTAFLNAITVDGNITPTTNNSRDLGAFSNAWQSIYASSTAFLDYASSTILEVRTAIYPDANNGADLGIFGTAWNDVFASGTLFLGSVTSTMIEPWADDTSDLGSFGKAWKDMFASGTLYISGSILTQNAAGPSILNEASTVTNPSLIPDRSDETAGIGGTSGGVSIITGGSERMNFASGGNVGIASSTPFAQLSIGAGAGTTSTLSMGKFCMHAESEDGTDLFIYIPLDQAANQVFATTTVSCF